MSTPFATSAVADRDPLLIPAPQRLALAGGWLRLPHRGLVRVAPGTDLAGAAGRLCVQARAWAGADWRVTVAPVASATVDVRLAPDAHLPPEGYRLAVSGEAVTIEASHRPGALAGLSTLVQLVRQYGAVLPTMAIEDAPDLPVRGVMLDVSRTKVPTMPTLFALVDRLAQLKVNHLELYMEHTFAYADHIDVWEGASPFTGAEILALDGFCRERGIELVANQNTLGHLTRWLETPRYRHLAETPDGSDFPWGRHPPFSISPALPESLAFVRGLLDELLPHFSSRLVNIGFDEGYDVGQGKSKALVEASGGKGRVLVDFLHQVSAIAQAHGRRPLFWADMVTRHYPEQIARLPADGIACEWGYAADHDWTHFAGPLAEAGYPFYLCPGTSSWRSFTGRNAAGEANIRAAAAAARTLGAQGILNTDWGDLGHMQPLPVSYRGLALGAALSWSGRTGDDFDMALGLHMFGDRTGLAGEAVADLGLIHARSTGERAPGEEDSFLSLALFRPAALADLRRRLSAQRADRVRELVAEADQHVSRAPIGGPDADLVREELVHAGRALLLAVDAIEAVRPPAGVRADLLAWQEEFRRLWLARFRPGGLEESLAFLAPLRAHVGAR